MATRLKKNTVAEERPASGRVSRPHPEERPASGRVSRPHPEERPASGRVSKDGSRLDRAVRMRSRRLGAAPFETVASRPPQGEDRRNNSALILRSARLEGWQRAREGQSACVAVHSGVIPGEPRKRRDPGSISPCRADFVMPGDMDPGSRAARSAGMPAEDAMRAEDR